jgi:hypothetical protein
MRRDQAFVFVVLPLIIRAKRGPTRDEDHAMAAIRVNPRNPRP